MGGGEKNKEEEEEEEIGGRGGGLEGGGYRAYRLCGCKGGWHKLGCLKLVLSEETTFFTLSPFSKIRRERGDGG